MAATKIGTTIQINETDSSFDADKILLNEDGLLFSKAGTIDIGSTVTADGGEVVNILQANEPRIICALGGIVQIPLLQAGEITATNATGAEICGEVTLGLSGSTPVSTTAVQSNSIILVTPSEAPTGIYYTHTITPSTSFVIESTAGGTDAGLKVKWLIINPA